ncbi:MAG: discoidin domain-containing protein [Eubacteriales bacterium]|nr:discoidin domain-containing protein [Eubacteriales bacterium]
MKKLLAIILSLCMVAGIATALVLSASADTSAPDISDYVTDGLAAFYTAGYHSEDGNTWLDASGKNVNIDLSSLDKENNYFDDENGVFMNKATKVQFDSAIVSLISSGKFTTEMVIKNTEVLGTQYGTYMNCANDNYSTFIRLTALPLIYVEFKDGINARPKVEIADKDYFKDSTVTITYDLDAGVCCMYVNGVLLQSVTPTTAFTVDNFYFGHEDASRSHNTEFAGFRFYDRALTAAEVAANYAADTGEPLDPEESSSETSTEIPTETTVVNIAIDKTYTVSETSLRDDGWDDNGIKLTDGVKLREDSGSTDIISGFSAQSVEVVIDLGEVTAISGFYADLIGNNGWGIASPTTDAVEFLYSTDGSDYTSVQKVEGTDLTPVYGEEGGWVVYEFTVDTNAEARYVKVIYTGTGAFLWTSEIEVYTQVEVETSEEPSADISDNETSEGGTPITGDTGFAALAILSVIALAGIAVIKRK